MLSTAPQTAASRFLCVLCVLCVVVVQTACHRGRKGARVRVPRAAPAAGVAAPLPGETEYGYASWYGHPYHGRATSSGETYDMYAMTAAHRTLPFGTEVEVTNMESGRRTRVRINDRGPFVDGRIIDLSLTAAKTIGVWGPGTALVQLRVVRVPGVAGAASPAEPAPVPSRASSPLPTSIAPAAAGRFTVQVGAFGDRRNAERLRGQLAQRYPQYPVNSVASPDGGRYRVWVGNEASEEQAGVIAQLLRRERVDAFVIRLD
jgi:rare lipoprotein A